MARSANDRILGVLLVGWGLLGVLWARCAWLQVVAAPRYAALAAGQHDAREVIRAQRGGLYDRHGRPLAVSVPSPSIFADPRSITAKRDVARQLANAVGGDARMIQRRLEKDKRFVWIARQQDLPMASAVLTMHDAGVGIIEEPKRLYPHGRLGSHVLGFVDVDQRGLEGLELAFNETLQGRDGWRTTLRDAKGHLVIGPWTEQRPPSQGRDVILTIDGVVQQAAEETLEWGVKTYRAKGGSIIIMDPDTGAILALANAPTYDTNAPAKVPADRRRNRAITDVFEPGSTFKIVTAAALLEEGKVAPEEPFFCENGAYRTVGRHILHDHRPHGILPFREVMTLSSNIGVAKAAQRLTPSVLHGYIRRFGFGAKTGIDVPGEVSGIVPPPARWSKLSPFIIPIGQEVAATPVQLAVMTAVIANGGLRVHPHVVDRVQTLDGRVVASYQPHAPVRVISAQTASIVQDMLQGVVESGTGQLANVQGLTVAGKTGTAQKIEPTGRYSHSRFVASFVGFGPVPDSRFVMVICMDEPRPLYFGGVVSAPMFKRIVERLAGYWELTRHVSVELPQDGSAVS